MINFNISAESDDIARLLAAADPQRLLPGLELQLRHLVTTNLLTNYVTKPNRLGGTSTGYWQKVIDSISSEVGGDSVRLSLTERGVALHYYGGTVVPKGVSEITGKPITRLTIPVIAAAHGHSVAEIPGLKIGTFPQGFGLGKEGQLYFILARSATFTADPNILPADLTPSLQTWLEARFTTTS